MKLFEKYYPGCTPREIVYDFILDHPDCCAREIRETVRGIQVDYFLRKFREEGIVEMTGENPQRFRSIEMTELFKQRYKGMTPKQVLIQYIQTHPGCTRGDMVKDLPSISHESYLRKLERDGVVERFHTPDKRLRWRMKQ